MDKQKVWFGPDQKIQYRYDNEISDSENDDNTSEYFVENEDEP